ncbi:hypothetical protein [Sporofaciens sp. SGI.106]|uniref:hypothetical protein n=1 Tax=Sporofaciens sp. SGI.106 TaxID=3420568 RepID=UPI002A94CC91|nr:hypothetical protein [Lachnoclostridium sp.]
MTSLDKQIRVKNVIQHMCDYIECPECEFYRPEDDTDGNFYCAIRDYDKRVPYQKDWDMRSAMVSD